MWVGRGASRPLPPAPAPVAAAPICSILSNTSLYMSTPRAANKILAGRAGGGYFHITVTGGELLCPFRIFLSGGRRMGGLAMASASSRNRSERATSPEFLERDFDDDDDEWEDGGAEEEDGPAMPFEEMKRWLRNKPTGFGEGKRYDTSIEDKLLEEIEQSRKVQLANINKLKSEATGEERPAQQQSRLDVAEAAPVACVCMRGLPRKKNVHKDLRLAFKRFQGIVNISPAVVGSKKTRDPVCKGFAFIGFESNEAANKFVQTYSKQSILFGRVQKEITCDIVSTFHSQEPRPGNLRQQAIFTKQLLIDSPGVISETTLGVSSHGFDERSVESSRKITVEDLHSPYLVDAASNTEYAGENCLVNEDRLGPGSDVEAVKPGMTKQKQKVQKASGKKSVKTKPIKTTKLNLPSSVARLKVKERAVLAGVLVKYGEQCAPVLSETK